jgi:hypothetical protein
LFRNICEFSIAHVFPQFIAAHLIYKVDIVQAVAIDICNSETRTMIVVDLHVVIFGLGYRSMAERDPTLLQLIRKMGSSQQSDEGRILGGFLKSDEFGLGGGQPLCLQQQIVQVAVASATT